jgi:hypothetical protein
MSPEPKQRPIPLNYRTPAPREKPVKSFLERVGIRFVAGCGTSTLIAAILILREPPRAGTDYPPTVACGGIFVVLVQWALLAFPATCRPSFDTNLLQERSAFTTFLAGLVGGALTFILPMLSALVSASDVVAGVATLLPLCVYPVVMSFLVFYKPHRPAAVQQDAQ